MTNIRRVAELAGVSTATVSRAFSDPDKVSEATLQKVLKAARKSKYTPNLLARNFRSARSYSVVVLVPNIANPFFSRIIRGIEEGAQQNGYAVLLGSFRDTQCGLKGFRSDVGRFLFARARTDGFAFDIELLHLVERHDLSLVEVPVEVSNSTRTTVRVVRDTARLVRDLFRMRHWAATGVYEVEVGSAPDLPPIEGEGQVEYLMMYRSDGSATFVGLEQVVGRIGGKTGSFVLQRTGVFEGGLAQFRALVVGIRRVGGGHG